MCFCLADWNSPAVLKLRCMDMDLLVMSYSEIQLQRLEERSSNCEPDVVIRTEQQLEQEAVKQVASNTHAGDCMYHVHVESLQYIRCLRSHRVLVRRLLYVELSTVCCHETGFLIFPNRILGSEFCPCCNVWSETVISPRLTMYHMLACMGHTADMCCSPLHIMLCTCCGGNETNAGKGELSSAQTTFHEHCMPCSMLDLSGKICKQ